MLRKQKYFNVPFAIAIMVIIMQSVAMFLVIGRKNYEEQDDGEYVRTAYIQERLDVLTVDQAREHLQVTAKGELADKVLKLDLEFNAAQELYLTQSSLDQTEVFIHSGILYVVRGILPWPNASYPFSGPPEYHAKLINGAFTESLEIPIEEENLSEFDPAFIEHQIFSFSRIVYIQGYRLGTDRCRDDLDEFIDTYSACDINMPDSKIFTEINLFDNPEKYSITEVDLTS